MVPNRASYEIHVVARPFKLGCLHQSATGDVHGEIVLVQVRAILERMGLSPELQRGPCLHNTAVLHFPIVAHPHKYSMGLAGRTYVSLSRQPLSRAALFVPRKNRQ